MTLGLTDGTNNMGLFQSDSSYRDLRAGTPSYGTEVGDTNLNSSGVNKTLGITTDPTKSGIIVEPDNNIKIIIKF